MSSGIAPLSGMGPHGLIVRTSMIKNLFERGGHIVSMTLVGFPLVTGECNRLAGSQPSTDSFKRVAQHREDFLFVCLEQRVEVLLGFKTPAFAPIQFQARAGVCSEDQLQRMPWQAWSSKIRTCG